MRWLSFQFFIDFCKFMYFCDNCNLGDSFSVHPYINNCIFWNKFLCFCDLVTAFWYAFSYVSVASLHGCNFADDKN